MRHRPILFIAAWLCLLAPASGASNEPIAKDIAMDIQSGEISSAEHKLSSWTPTRTDAWLPTFFRAQIAFSSGNTKQAIELLTPLLTRHPRPEIYNNLASYHIAENNFDQAQVYLNEAINGDTRYQIIYQNLSRLFSHKAGLAYQQALNLEEKKTALKLAMIHLPDTTATTTTPGIINATPETGAPDPQAVINIVNKWATAWSEQNVFNYLSLYSDKFKPLDGTTLETWKTYRRNRLLQPSFIQVKAININVNFLGAEQYAHVHFIQHYKSNTFQEKIHKLLVLQKESNGWRIIIEAVS